MLSSADDEMRSLGLLLCHPYTVSREEIQKINAECDYDIGIYREPAYIPLHIKEYVLYKRWKSGGSSGASCWSDAPSTPFDGDPEPDWKPLTILLKKWGKEQYYWDIISNLERESSQDDNYDYYGNYDSYGIKYIVYSDLIEYLMDKT